MLYIFYDKIQYKFLHPRFKHFSKHWLHKILKLTMDHTKNAPIKLFLLNYSVLYSLIFFEITDWLTIWVLCCDWLSSLARLADANLVYGWDAEEILVALHQFGGDALQFGHLTYFLPWQAGNVPLLDDVASDWWISVILRHLPNQVSGFRGDGRDLHISGRWGFVWNSRRKNVITYIQFFYRIVALGACTFLMMMLRLNHIQKGKKPKWMPTFYDDIEIESHTKWQKFNDL